MASRRAPESPSRTDPAQILRVGSYNVHRCVGGDGRCDPDRVAQVIREIDCDPLGLQEVDNSPGPTPTSMQLDYLARATRMTAVAGLRIVRHRGHYGNALLTRRRVLEVRRHDLTFSWREPRGALDVDLEIGSRVARIIVTHLGLTPGERRRQMRRILSIVGDGHGMEPLVLLGDINEWLPLGRPLRWLHALFGRPPAVRSFPAVAPLLALDRVWVRPRGALLSVSAHRSAAARLASDHLPVTAELALSAVSDSRAAPHCAARAESGS